MTDDAGGLTFRLMRTMPAPRARVFEMHADPQQFARWWGPRGFSTRRVELDLRAGGRYRIGMQPPDGGAFWLTGEFLEVDAPALLRYSFLYEEPDPEDRETIVTFALRERGTSSEVVVEQGPFATERRRALHEQGWSETLDRLQETLAGEAH
jgi:uncharacterized protein YndB with AHSA1/START domain